MTSAQIRSDARWLAQLARGASWPGEMAEKVERAAERVIEWADAEAAITHVDGPPTFEAFYAAYPRKVGKKAARRAWDKAVKDDPPAEIVAGAQRFAAHWADQPKERQGFIPYPATWLNAGSWADELVPHASTVSKVDKTRSNLVEAARRMEVGDTFEQRMAGARRLELGA